MTQSYIEMIQTGQVGRITPNYGYYRQSNGWITVAVTTELEELKYRREGWEPLPQYGRFDMTAEYAANHPLELLFMRGGAKELPIEQVIESGFHLRPPLVPSCGRALTQAHVSHIAACWVDAKPVTFPQLKGVKAEAFPCTFCDRPPFPTDKARQQHEYVIHKTEKGELRTGEALATALLKGLGGERTQAENLVLSEEILGEGGAKAIRLPYICGLCDAGYTSPIQLTRHIKKHKEIADAEVQAES